MHLHTDVPGCEFHRPHVRHREACAPLVVQPELYRAGVAQQLAVARRQLACRPRKRARYPSADCSSCSDVNYLIAAQRYAPAALPVRARHAVLRLLRVDCGRPPAEVHRDAAGSRGAISAGQTGGCHREPTLATPFGPFPHVFADRVFTKPFYKDELELAVAEVVDSGKLSPLERHDIFGRTLTSETRGPLAFFLSREWADLLARVFGVTSTGFINCGVHHHATGSANGFPHNDVNPGWFIDQPSEDGVVLPQPDRCVYTSGKKLDPSAEPVQMVRSVAMLFYVANDPWQPGDGGETRSLPVWL